ncbi:hypothetical protein DM867_12440 [Halosegnis rubeus]|jgi:Na+/phosphate symporter|uniref:Uncharacterized protein n=1 Tax=Halosegnis rubeus TaxID=2212850 RepID=A0A5N5U252_9EURY|nr:hypothetical protein [Halosegnis rubeus]KAB7512545.1 hypothetical protein DM867_12440 [Halosegnis rubeus]KAB7517830.1 hypothetical protein DMP03_00225 [Halosegnis rubeus]
MDIDAVREWLGSCGEYGALALLAGVLVVATRDKRIAAGVATVVVGLGLIAGGLVDTALEKMGMKGAL